jgi:hypothetical protein
MNKLWKADFSASQQRPKKMVYQLEEKNELSRGSNKSAGTDWPRVFHERHPEISL